VLPADVSLQTLQAQAPAAAAAASSTASTTSAAGSGPTGFVVNGTTGSQRRVALVLDRLAGLPWLSDITLQQSARTSSDDVFVVQFTIGANLRSTGGQS
jgi:hypothetical protein